MDSAGEVKTETNANGDVANKQDSNNNSQEINKDSSTNNKNSESSNRNSKSSSSSGRGNRSRNRSGSRRRSRSPPTSRSREDRSSMFHKRVYVANIPFGVRWSELKDLFREHCGGVRFCRLFEDEQGKPRGCGLVEFEDSSYVKKAIEKLNRFEFKGRELVVKEDLDIERDRYGRLLLDRDRDRDRDRRSRHDRYDDRHYSNGSSEQGPIGSSGGGSYYTYGLTPEFLSSLGIHGPLNNRVFVANLDYKVSEHKLEDIFALAGKVIKVRLYMDGEGKSKGFGVVEFSHPVEAVQAISMFNNQKLYDRILSVRLDKFDDESFGQDGMPAKLPRGLESIGKGLGIGGQPLNISKSGVNSGVPPPSIGVPPPAPIPPPTATAQVNPQAASAAINVLTNLAGGLQNLPSLTHSLAQISNPSAASAPPGVSAPTAYQTTTSDMGPIGSNVAPNTNASAYSGYSTVPAPNGTTAGNIYQGATTSGQMIPQPTGYGPPQTPSNVTPYPTSTPVANQPISSYSTYDPQRDYHDDKYRRSGGGAGGIDTIFVRNLPLTFSWQNLRDRFNEVGEVLFAEMKGHGTAVVRFATDREAQRAVDLMNGIRIENRAIDVSFYY